MTIDPHVRTLLDGLAAQGMQSFEQLGVQATREVVATFTELQAPPRTVARVIETSYTGPAGEATCADLRSGRASSPCP